MSVLAAALPAGTAAQPDAAAEAAVGRLNHAGYRQRMHCTATVIAPDRALTAAHCLEDRTADRLFLLPGYDRGSRREDLRVKRAVAAPHPRDVAVLCLVHPAATRPLALAADGPRPGERLLVIGYPLPRAHAQSRFTCTVGARGPNGTFTLSCPMKSGASGSPVLRRTEAGAEVVGVLAATTERFSVAFDVSGGTVAGRPLPACE